MRDPRLFSALEDEAGPDLARQAAGHARRRRSGRRALAGAVTAAAAIAALLWINPNRDPNPGSGQFIAPSASLTSYEVLSDQELIKYLANEPVLILKDHDKVSGVVFLSAPGEKL